MWRKYKGFRTFLYQTRARLPIAQFKPTVDTMRVVIKNDGSYCIAMQKHSQIKDFRSTSASM